MVIRSSLTALTTAFVIGCLFLGPVPTEPPATSANEAERTDATKTTE